MKAPKVELPIVLLRITQILHTLSCLVLKYLQQLTLSAVAKNCSLGYHCDQLEEILLCNGKPTKCVTKPWLNSNIYVQGCIEVMQGHPEFSFLIAIQVV